MTDRTKDQRVYPTRTADRCSDCPPAGYPTEKTRCYGCPLANTYKDATGELVIPTAAPSSNQRVLQGALARLIDGVRSVNIDRREWYTHIAQPLQDAYQALGGPTGLGMTAEEIARLRDESPVETSDRPPMRTGLELIRDGQIPQGMSPALFADRVLRVAAQLTGDPYKAMCQGGSGGKCTDPDCEKCWPEEPSPVTNSSGSVSRPVDVPALAVGADQPTGAAALEAGTAHPPRVLEKDVELDLTCEEYIEDPHSRFCDRCGYPEREHKRAGSQENGSPEQT